jgi:glycosyltransferase involved in cell wall biosynthesis
MAIFSLYTIHHLQFDAISTISLPQGNHYLVIWSGKIPLGHYWLEADKGPVSLGDYREELETIVRPALEQISFKRQASIDKQKEQGEASHKLQAASDKQGGARGNRAGGLSVVICTRNRPKDLERCVHGLLNSADTDFELIVVDNAPDDDRTEQVVRRFPLVRYIREERKGLDIARNTGARAAVGAIIAYTDDDVVVGGDWTGQLKDCFNDPLVMAVTGLVIPAQLQTRAQYIFERYWSFNKGYLEKGYDHRYFLDHLPWGVPAWDIGAGANMAFRREAFELAGWFDERLDVGASGCSGDSEFWYRILAEGWNCRYFPQLVVYHNHRESEAELSNQLFHYMRGHVSALLVQYERYGHKGNLWRLRRALPQYYLKRIGGWILGKDRQARENSRYLLREIRGCFSGWRFYRSVRAGRLADGSLAGDGYILPIPPRLLEPAAVREDALVSIIIPCYNHAHWLEAAIATVAEQTYKNTEIVVVDDGSTDGTAIVCLKYEKVRYVRVERVGPSIARNIGVQCSKGDFIVFLDADDLLYPNAIELNLYYFTLYKQIAFVSGGHDRIDEKGKYLPVHEAVVKSGDNYWALLQGNYIAMEGTVMYRRQVFFRWHFDPAVQTCEDYDLNLRVARYLPVFGHSGKVAAYRIHGENRSKDQKMMAASALSVLKKQEKLLQNGEEMQAYRLGIQNWTNYYVIDTENKAKND